MNADKRLTKRQRDADRRELLVCRLKALVRARWPDEYNARPKLRLIQGGKA